MKKILVLLLSMCCNAYGAKAAVSEYPDWQLMGSDKIGKIYRDDESSLTIKNVVGGWEKTVLITPQMMSNKVIFDAILSYTLYDCESRRYLYIMFGALYKNTMVIKPVEVENSNWVQIEPGSIRETIGKTVCLPIKASTFTQN